MGREIDQEIEMGNGVRVLNFKDGRTGILWCPNSIKKEKSKDDKWEMLRDLIMQEFETCMMCEHYNEAYAFRKVLDHMKRIENEESK